jgi:hypothetical protein
MAQVTSFDVQSLRGMTLAAARKAASAAGYRLRIRIEDGRPAVCTMDYDSQRINVEVISGRVVAVRGVG